MTIVIQSKNGEPFLPSCLKHLKKNTSDAKIVLVDNGWENAAFLDRMVDEFQISGEITYFQTEYARQLPPDNFYYRCRPTAAIFRKRKND